MTRRHIFSGGAWEEIAGYARAVVCRLVSPEMKVEIEVTARRRAA